MLASGENGSGGGGNQLLRTALGQGMVKSGSCSSGLDVNSGGALYSRHNPTDGCGSSLLLQTPNGRVGGGKHFVGGSSIRASPSSSLAVLACGKGRDCGNSKAETAMGMGLALNGGRGRQNSIQTPLSVDTSTGAGGDCLLGIGSLLSPVSDLSGVVASHQSGILQRSGQAAAMNTTTTTHNTTS